MKLLPLVTVLVICGVIAWGLMGWIRNDFDFNNLLFKPSALLNSPAGSPLSSGTPVAAENGQGVTVKIEPWVQGLEVPWSLAFTSSERLLITERSGRVRVVINGQLQTQPLHTFAEVRASGEQGFMGMAVDPNYASNKYLYFSLAYPAGDGFEVKIVRFTDQGTSLTDEKTILDGIPAAQVHAGNRIKFGPDGKLYVSTGDATEKTLAQDQKSLAGKFLRVNADGSVPADNPFPNSVVYSVGHRNPQGFDWNPETDDLWATEHGPSTFDGPAGGDEINLIQAGQNYGWPLVSHDKNQTGLIAPKLMFTPAIAPAAGLFYTGEALPQYKNNFLVALLKGNGIIRVVFSPTDSTQVQAYEKLPDISVGRVREIIQGSDGYIYFTSSNRDGRGQVQNGDDKIYRMLPG